MLDIFRNAWKIEDLRKRILFTLLILFIFRVGVAIPVPFLRPDALANMIGGSGNMLGYLDLLTGGAFSKATLFALSVTPYINASIIVNLLQVAIPYLERLAQEGEEGRRKIMRITRWAGFAIAMFLSVAYYFLLQRSGALLYTEGFGGILSAIVIILAFAAGSMLIMWLGEQIDDKGIGNGISLLIFAGIVSRLPQAITSLKGALDLAGQGQTQYYFFVPILLVLTVLAVAFIVIMNNAERRIPVQYAKRVVGRRMYGGQSSHIPVKLNMSGVMPVIFASALISIPGTLRAIFGINDGFWASALSIFNYNSWGYAFMYVMLILAFNYFYVSLQYNPTEIANNIRKNNGTIPGIRPGKPTEDFVNRSISRITLIGAIFLAIIALMPIVLGNMLKMNIQLGGTSLIIVVGVALDTARQLEAYMLMRHHKGFLE